MEHATLCMARLIRAMFGVTAVADRKLECGLNLIVLGVDLNMNSAGYMCRPAADKAQKTGQAHTRSFAHEVLAGRCRTKVYRTTELELLVYVKLQQTGKSDVATFL